MLFNALVTATAFVALVLGVYFVAQTVVMRGFGSVESEQGHENGLRLRFAIRARVLQLEDVGLSWADWTEAFHYVQEKSPAKRASFERAELSDAGLAIVDCDILSYISTDGHVVFARLIDRKRARTHPTAPAFIEAVKDSGLLDHLSQRPTQSAIIRLNGQPLVVALQRVHQSGHPKNWSGVVLLGRWMNANVKGTLREQLRLPIEMGAPTPAQARAIAPLASLALGADQDQAGRFKVDGQSPVRLSESAGMLRVETIFLDPRGRPVLWASALMPHTVQEQGQASVNSFLLALMGLGSVSLVVALGLQSALARADGARQRESDTFDLMTRHLPDHLVIRDLSNGLTRAYGGANTQMSGGGGKNGDDQSDWLDLCLDAKTRARRQTILAQTIASGQAREVEWEESGRVWLEMLSPVRGNGHEQPVSHLISASIDISDRKAAEREKDVLLKEIHHRVKNNLQIVVSLLNLQSDAVQDPQARAQFEDARARVRSMALIHEQLYRQDDLSHVDFGAYLQSLLSNILRSYSKSPVELQSDLHSVWLDIDIAVPCGLIVTELVSNAFKHAFKTGEGTGILRVQLRPLDGERVQLCIEDSGPGLPPEFCLEESESLGLQIVDSLVTQIDACIQVSAGQEGRGTRWTLDFAPVESSGKRLVARH